VKERQGMTWKERHDMAWQGKGMAWQGKDKARCRSRSLIYLVSALSKC
jgi:hypothetical protein